MTKDVKVELLSTFSYSSSEELSDSAQVDRWYPSQADKAIARYDKDTPPTVYYFPELLAPSSKVNFVYPTIIYESVYKKWGEEEAEKEEALKNKSQKGDGISL